MTLTLTMTGIRRHPFSFVVTIGLALSVAGVTSVPPLTTFAVWAALTVAAFELWYALEPWLLRRFGSCRPPSPSEHERLHLALARSPLQPLIADTADLVVARGARCLVIGRDLLDALDDRPLSGLLGEAAASVHYANLAGICLVWVGNLPILGAWCLTRMLTQVGRLLGVVVGESLVLPLVLWPHGFVRWSGRVFGSLLVGVLGAMLLAAGFTAAGACVMVAWLLVAGLGGLLARESRRVQRAADRATIDAGLGPQLLEALEFLTAAEPAPRPGRLVAVLRCPGVPLSERAVYLRRMLAVSADG